MTSRPRSTTTSTRQAPPFGNRSLRRGSAGLLRRSVPAASAATRTRSSTNANTTFIPARRVRRDRSRHQLAARAVVERHGRAAARHRLGRVGELSRQLLGSPLGPGGDQSRRLPRARALHAARRVLSRSARPPRTSISAACCTLARIRRRRTLIGNLDLHTDVGTQNYRGLKLSFRRRAGERHQPERQLHLSRCFGDTDDRRLPAAQRRLHRARRTRRSIAAIAIRTGRTSANVTVGDQTPQFDDARAARRSRRTGGCRAFSTRARAVWLNVTTGRDTAFTGIQQQRVQQRAGRSVSSEKTLLQLPEPGGVRAAGAGHARQLPAQRRHGPGLLGRRPGALAARSRSARARTSSCASRRSTC